MEALATLTLALVVACSVPVRRHDWSAYTGPGRELLLAEEVPFPAVPDPLEPFNRVAAGLTHGILRFVLAPVARVYRVFVPGEARASLARAGKNLLFPGRLVNNLLQGDLRGGGRETARFLLNSTFGLGGLQDPARDVGILPSNEDVGRTFARWGWTRSTYLFLPLLGPSSIRDGIGRAGDTALDPLRHVRPWAPFARGFNDLSDKVEGGLRVAKSEYDAYQATRLLYTYSRVIDPADELLPGDDSGEVQTLQSVFLQPEDPDFCRGARTRTAAMEGGREVTYSIWLRPDADTLAFLVPGFGNHRLSDATLGEAEVIYEKGFSVVAVSSTTAPEFMIDTAASPYPGYTPADASDVQRALHAIDRDVARRWPERRFEHRIVVGLSLGALQTLFLAAAAADPAAPPDPFDLYVALDPAVSLEHAATTLDAYYNVPLRFPREERQQRIDAILSKVLLLSESGLEPDMELPFRRWEAEFLIGLSFRLRLQSVILQSQDLHDAGILETPRSRLRRASAFVEASEYSFREYLYAFALPWYASRLDGIGLDEAGAQELLRRADLRAVEDGLRANPAVRVFTNADDFLLAPEDLSWLRDVLGERLIVFPEGGHLGNLHREGIQRAIDAIVKRSVEEEADAPVR